MSTVIESLPLERPSTVGKKRNDTEPKPDAGRPITFRAPADLAEELDDIGEALGLDVSNLVRMVLRENLSQYRERADRARREMSKSKKGGD